MESFIAEGTDQIIPELSPEAYQNQASYVVSRTQTRTSCPTPTLSPNSVRTAKISIVDGNFIDLSSCWFSFTVRNTAVTADAAEVADLQPLSAIPHCWFRRAIIRVNGATVDDVMHLNRVEEQISRFVSTNKKRNWGDAGHGWESLTDSGVGVSKVIKKGQERRAPWRPLSLGFFTSAQKLLPMMGGAASWLTF